MRGCIYRHRVAVNSTPRFSATPAWVGEGRHMPCQTPRPARHAQRRKHSAQRRGYCVCSAIHRVCSDMHQKQAICRKQSQLLNKILILLVNFGMVKRERTLKYQRFCGDCILCSIIQPPVVQLDGVIYPFCRCRWEHQRPRQKRRKCSR